MRLPRGLARLDPLTTRLSQPHKSKSTCGLALCGRCSERSPSASSPRRQAHPPSPGDLGYVTGKFFKAGKPFGRYTGVCAQLNGGNQQCTFVLGLPDGQIVSTAGYGPGMNVGNTAREAIVGGTGAYEGAHGQGDDRETGNKGQLHLHLLR